MTNRRSITPDSQIPYFGTCLIWGSLIGSFRSMPTNSSVLLVAFAVSCLVGVVFGLLPAVRASKLSPTEALRYE